MSTPTPPPPTDDDVEAVPPPPPESAAVAPVDPLSSFTRDEKPVITGVELGALLIAGFLLNIAARVGITGVAAAASVLVLAAGILVSGRVQQRQAQWLVVAVMALAPWLMIRSSPALTAATIAAILLVGALAAGISRNGRLFDLPFVALATHVVSQAIEWVYGLEMIQRFVRRQVEGRQGGAVLRGVAVAAPVLLVFGVLLASADEVFASFLLFDNLPSLVGHGLATLFFAVALLGLVARAAHETSPVSARARTSGLAPIEIVIVLGSLAALFAAFVGTQIAVAVGGVDHVLETEGLTQSQHARQGFFQLLWVAVLSIGLLGALRAFRRDDDGRDRFRPLALLVLLLTFVIAAISMQRLLLYVGSFDLTPLRVWALAATGWIMVVIAAYALSIGGLRADRSWFPGAMVVSAAVFVFGINVVNPDAIVARYNMANQSSGQVDVRALSQLSDDAVLAMLTSMDDLDEVQATRLSSFLCDRFDLNVGYGVLGWTRAERNADWLLDKHCEGQRPLDRDDWD